MAINDSDKTVTSLDKLLVQTQNLEASNQVDECDICQTKTDKILTIFHCFSSKYFLIHFEQNSLNQIAFSFDVDYVLISNIYFKCNCIIFFDRKIEHYYCWKRNSKRTGWIKIDSLHTEYEPACKYISSNFSYISMILLEKC